jgi:hypothetical protein
MTRIPAPVKEVRDRGGYDLPPDVRFACLRFSNPIMESDFVNYAYSTGVIPPAVASFVAGAIAIVLVFTQLSLTSGAEGPPVMALGIINFLASVAALICWKLGKFVSPVSTERWWLGLNGAFMLGQAIMSHNRIQNTICKSTTFKPTRFSRVCDNLIDGNQAIGCAMLFIGCPRTVFTAPMLLLFVVVTWIWRFIFWELAMHDYDFFCFLMCALFGIALHSVEVSTRLRFVQSVHLRRQMKLTLVTRDSVNRMLEAVVAPSIVHRMAAGEEIIDAREATALFSDIADSRVGRAGTERSTWFEC